MSLSASATTLAVLASVLVIGPNQYEVRLQTEVAAPAERCWTVLTDYANHAKRLTPMRKSEVVSGSGPRKVVDQEGAIKVIFWTFVVRVRLAVQEDQPKMIRFQALDGDFKRMDGEWSLGPSTADPGKTHLVGRWSMEPKRKVPAWAVRFVTKHYLVPMVERLGTWMEEGQTP